MASSSSMFVQIISFVVMIMVMVMEPSDAFKYYVGGKDGWSLKPSKAFNHWASLNRFQLNDSLIFKYEKGTDSVLQVDQEDYVTCNKANPIKTLENKGDDSTFNLDHSGFFFFISGHDDNCKKGEKVIILVMAPRNYTRKSPTPAPSPFHGVVSPAHGVGPVSSQAPSPFQGDSPVSSRAPSPFQGVTPAPSPVEHKTPVLSPAPSPSPFHRIPHFHPPAHAPIRQVTHVLPPAQSPDHVHKITPILAPAPSRVGQSTHHHTHSPAPSPTQKTTPTSTPAPSPTAVNENPPAAAPGPSDQAPSPDDGKSAAPTSFKADLLMAVLLFWIIFN